MLSRTAVKVKIDFLRINFAMYVHTLYGDYLRYRKYFNKAI